MLRKIICLNIFLFPAFLCAQDIDKLISKADSLYLLPNPSEVDDQRAIKFYESALIETPNPAQVSTFIQGFERLGSLYSVYSQHEQAVQTYRKGIRLATSLNKPDTLLYALQLYLGESLFALSKVDSSVYHLKKAEEIQAKIQSGLQPARLFNALGVYYFETGNYSQSIRYFSRAESYLKGFDGEYEKYARYSFLSNKASALYYLGKYDSARNIYSDLLELGINPNQIKVNLANSYLEEGFPLKALEVLEKVQISTLDKPVSFQNLQAKSRLMLGENDKAESILKQIKAKLITQSESRKNLERSVYYDLMGRLMQEKGDLNAALEFFHKGIIELHPTFENKDVLKNPDYTSLGMASVSLFEILIKKAVVAWSLYDLQSDKKWFDLGLATFLNAFEYANYISFNFDNDEARLFLGDQVLKSYQVAIDGLLNLSAAENKKDLMIQAFVWAEQSKAAALRLGLFIKKEKKQAGVPLFLLEEEENLQFLLARNYQQQYEASNPDVQEDLTQEYIKNQVLLSRLKEQIKNYLPEGNKSSSFKLFDFQKELGTNTASLTLFQTQSKLLVFWVENDFFDYRAINLKEIDLKMLETWREDLQRVELGNSYQAGTYIPIFSEKIFGPWKQRMKCKNQLLLIPHQEFNAIPFEALPIDEEYLIQKIGVFYQFSGASLLAKEKVTWNSDLVLGFAPFASSSNPEFSVLPGSDQEIKRFKKNSFLDEAADYSAFIQNAPSHPFIHLATHAVASDQDSNSSFLAFYPSLGDFRLFSQELSLQDLDFVDFVFLSACETGAGLLSSSEGLVSLARSFALAGADHLLTSLWLTENQVAVYLSNAFYDHLENGETYVEALRLAKLDLLNDPSMSQFSDPVYWANFVLIGQPEIVPNTNKRIWVVLLILSVGVLIFIVFWRKNRSIP